MARYLVIGGGITGLAAAWRLVQLPNEHQVLLLEGSARAGGILRSERRDGFLLEEGPDSFLTSKPACIELARELGLEAELLSVSPEQRWSSIVRGGRLYPIPEGFYLVAP